MTSNKGYKISMISMLCGKKTKIKVFSETQRPKQTVCDIDIELKLLKLFYESK